MKFYITRHDQHCLCNAACDIAEIRDNAKMTLTGGWQAQNVADEYVQQLYNHSTAIAAVRPGVIQEAYTQVRHDRNGRVVAVIT